MNRIYQGRVARVEIPDGKGGWQLLGFKPDEAERLEKERDRLQLLTKEDDAKGKEARKQLAEVNRKLNEPWQTALWKHHALFQDTVNYYLSAFAAMVDERTVSDGLREFREAVIRYWEKDVHSDGSWQMRVLGSTLSGRPAWKAFEKRIFSMTGSKASAEQRAAAVEAVFSDPTKVADDMEDAGATLEDKLRGRGRALFPKLKLLCGRVTGTTPDNVRFAQEKLARRAAKRVERKGKLSWKDVFAFKTSTERRPWTHEQAIECTKEAFDDVASELAEHVEAAKQREANRPLNNPVAVRQLTGSTAADLNKLHIRYKKLEKTFAQLLASPAFKPSKDEPVRAGSGGFDMKAAMVLASQPANRVFRDVFLHFNRRYLESPVSKGSDRPDAVYEARHAGGVERRVFPFFCDLWTSRLDDTTVELGVWPDFEKQAFIEVFNKVGQFIVTTKRFELRLIEADKIIAESKAQLKVDERLQRVKEAVESETLAGFDAIGNVRPYTVRERTLKGWSKVRQAWRDMLKTSPGSVAATTLVAEKNRLQTRLRERFGSAPLFDLLAQDYYRMIWNGEDEADPLKTWSLFEGCRQTLEDAREDRAKQIAHDIFALAVGVELTAPPADKETRKQSESLHGVYRCLERGPVNFIALEDLSKYGTSGTRGRRENRQLSSWSHRRIHKILTELCEPIGLRIGSRVDLPIVYVKPELTSRFSAKDHSAGFRAEEISNDDPRKLFWERQVAEDPECGWAEVLGLLKQLPDGKTLLIPRKGGPLFVSLGEINPANPNASLFHADLNAAYRIGLRALAHPDHRELFGTVKLKSTHKKRGTKTEQVKEQRFLVDVAKVLPGSKSHPDFPHQVAAWWNGLWDKVDLGLAWERCHKINRARFSNWKVPVLQGKNTSNDVPPAEEDDVP